MASNVDFSKIHDHYLNAASRYPINEGTSCAQLENMRANLQAEIDEVVRKRASGAMGLGNSEEWIQGFQQYLSVITSQYQNNDCQEKEKQAATQEAIDNNLQVLSSAADLAEKTTKSSKAANIAIWSMLGLLVLVAGIVFMKKLNAKKAKAAN